MRKKTKTSKAIIENSSNLSALLAKIEKVNKLQSLLLTALPIDLQEHCQVVNYHHGVLTIHVDSQTWAMKLRYQLPNLLEILRKKKKLVQLSSINYKVRPAITKFKKTLPKATLSSKNKQTLEEVKKILEAKE